MRQHCAATGERVALRWATVVSWGVLLLVTVVAPCRADEVNVIPALTVKESYNDNIFFSTGTPTSAFMTVVSPSVEMFDRTEAFSAKLLVRLDEFMYQGSNSQTSTLNHSYRGDFQLRPTPLTDLSAGYSYRINNRPDQALDQGGVALNATRRTRQQLSFDAGQQFTELTSARLYYAWELEDFNSSALSGTESHTGTVRFTHDLGRWLPPAKAILELGVGKYHFDKSQTDNLSASLGGIWSISETLSATALVGGRYTRSRYDTLLVSPTVPVTITSGTANTSSSGWVGQLTLAQQGERARGELTLSRNVAISSGSNSATETNALQGSLTYDLTPELTTTLVMGYQQDSADRQQFGAADIDHRYYRGSAGLSYKLQRDLEVSASYAFEKVQYREVDSGATRNVVFLGLTYNYPLLER